jgi:hypothetical protein
VKGAMLVVVATVVLGGGGRGGLHKHDNGEQEGEARPRMRTDAYP